LIGALRIITKLAPLLDQEIPLLWLEAGILLQQPELVSGAGEGLVTESGDSTVVGNRIQ
jgi:hypothetical protein